MRSREKESRIMRNGSWGMLYRVVHAEFSLTTKRCLAEAREQVGHNRGRRDNAKSAPHVWVATRKSVELGKGAEKRELQWERRPAPGSHYRGLSSKEKQSMAAMENGTLASGPNMWTREWNQLGTAGGGWVDEEDLMTSWVWKERMDQKG